MARKGDRVIVKWRDAEFSQDIDLAQDWSKYKITEHNSEGIIEYNGTNLLVVRTSRESHTSQGDVYTIPKGRWLIEIEVLKTKRQIQRGE